jgi:uncharacterized membrane protein
MDENSWFRDPRVVAVVALAAIVRFAQLGHESLWTDELITLDFVTRWSGLDLLVSLPQAQPHLPVYYLVLDAWIAVAGTSETALRFPSAIFGIAAVVAIYAVGTRLLDSEVGLLAALLLAVSPFHVRFSQEVRMYSLLVLLTLVSVYFFLGIRDEPSRRHVTGFALSTAVLIYTHVFAVFVVAAEGIYVAYRLYTGRSDRLRSWAVAFAPVGLAALPMVAAILYKLASSGGVSYSYVPLPNLWRVVTMISTYVGYGSGTRLIVHAVVIPLFVSVALIGLFRYRLDGFAASAPLQSLRNGVDLNVRPADADESVLLGAWFVVPFGLPIVLSYLVTPVFWPRYTIVASLGLFVLIARGLSHVNYGHLRYAMAGLLIISMVPSLGIYYTGDQKEQWREVGATIDEQAESGDLVLVADQITERGVRHYTDRKSLRIKGIVVEDSGTGYAAASNETIREMQRSEGRIWLVLSHASESERSRIRTIVADGREQTFHRQYEGVEVYGYVPEGET